MIEYHMDVTPVYQISYIVELTLLLFVITFSLNHSEGITIWTLAVVLGILIVRLMLLTWGF
jgi:hypothetical protein